MRSLAMLMQYLYTDLRQVFHFQLFRSEY